MQLMLKINTKVLLDERMNHVMKFVTSSRINYLKDVKFRTMLALACLFLWK